MNDLSTVPTFSGVALKAGLLKNNWSRRTGFWRAAILGAAFGAMTLGVTGQASAHKDPPTCLFNGPSTSISTQGIVMAQHGDRICYVVGIANSCPGCCNVTGLNSNLILPNGAVVPITANATVNQGDSFLCPSADPRCATPSNCTIPAMQGYEYVVDHADEMGQLGTGCPINPTAGTGTVWASILGVGVDHISPNDGTAFICQSIPVDIPHACCEPCSGTCTDVLDATECPFPSVFSPHDNCKDVVCTPLTCPGPVPPCESGQACDPATGQCVDRLDAPLSTPCEGCPGGDTPCNNCHCDGNGSCVDLPEPFSTPCEADENLCTIDHCDGNGLCVLLRGQCDDPIFCDDQDVCTRDTCDITVLGCCINEPIPCPPRPCHRITGCDPVDGCQYEFDCREPGENCCPDDGNPCTHESCDQETGLCGTTPDCTTDRDCADDLNCTMNTCENFCCVEKRLCECQCGDRCLSEGEAPGICADPDDDGVCTCTTNPDPECEGQTCGTFTTCNPGSPNCGDSGICGSTAEGGGLCVDGSTNCGGLADCASSADCSDGLCFVDSCCGRPVCVPNSQRCQTPSEAAAAAAGAVGPVCCADGASCDDLNACTVDECLEGCCSHAPHVCPERPCYRITGCDPIDGCLYESVCTLVPDYCDDQNVCTRDACDEAEEGCCLHVDIPCPERPCQKVTGCDPISGCLYESVCKLDPGYCNDQNVCTRDVCDEAEEGCCRNEDIPCPERPCQRITGCDPINGCLYESVCTLVPDYCDDQNVCTRDICDESEDSCCRYEDIPCPERPCQKVTGCDPINGCLYESVCKQVPDYCNDQNVCTRDICDDSVEGCCRREDIPCPERECHEVRCDAAEGCVYTNVCTCGDGDLDPGEDCDDTVFEPNAPSTHGPCRANCTYCGNGTKDGDEECDDGNDVNDDLCTNACTTGGDPCDDGNPCTVDRCKCARRDHDGVATGNHHDDDDDDDGEPCDCPPEACDGDGNVAKNNGGDDSCVCKHELVCTDDCCPDCDDGDPCTIDTCAPGYRDDDDDDDDDDDGVAHGNRRDREKVCECKHRNICRCGDGIINRAGETCDGPSFPPGTPPGAECRKNCTFCGDGIRQSRWGEECDGDDLGAVAKSGDDCSGGCDSNCKCIPRCGEARECRKNSDCGDRNSCTADSCVNGCCVNAPIIPCCGNGIRDGKEECDGDDLGECGGAAKKDAPGCTDDCKCASNDEGCSPGYWKNHTSYWNGIGSNEKTATIKTSTKFNTVLGVTGTNSGVANCMTLLAALDLPNVSPSCGKVGSPSNEKLALNRHTAAALANADTNLNYPYTLAEVIALYRDAVGAVSGPETISSAKAKLSAANELDCPY